MSTEERARRLVGDMPWITDHLSEAQIHDLRRQIQTCLEVAIKDAEEALLDVQVEIDQLADFAADSLELRISETNIVERLNVICEKRDWQISKRGRQLIREAK